MPACLANHNIKEGGRRNIVYTKPNGEEIHCYGSVEWDSNFHVCCDDEEFDGVVVDCDGETYDTWDKVCAYLMENYREDLAEITAV